MPIFEYRCSECAHLEEVLQKHTDPAPTECPACGKTGTMAKEISVTSFQLKGGGWYKDLYSSSSKSETKSESKSETKSESKSEAKAESKKDSGGSSSSSSSSGSSGGGSSGGGGTSAAAA